MPPKRIGPYRIEGTLGRGGIGTVYRAIDRRTGDAVALKLLSTGPALHPTAALRLAREFEALAEINHENVVRVFDTGVHEGYPYLAMELVDGLDLKSWLSMDLSKPDDSHETFRELLTSSQERLVQDADQPWSDEISKPATAKPFGLDALASEPNTDTGAFRVSTDSRGRGVAAVRALAALADEPDTDDVDLSGDSPVLFPEERPPHEPAAARAPSLEALNRPERISRLKDAVQQLCSAIAYIHGKGLVHRDLKPANVLVTEDRRVKLMDFGLAKFLAAETGVTDSRRIVGTYRYMAPEQAMGDPLDGRADLYSFGVMIYELLCGRPPYDARTPQELWQRVLESEPPALGSLNPGVDYTLALVAHRLLKKDPEDRFQTAEEIYEALME
ncbi:MAG TPA: serine/threonine-protein kinase [Myxococcales bacterium]|nr:serine/threonine-protein kinase [Myxococcales bacterium]